MSSARIQPLDPPYAPEIVDAFAKIMPPGMEPLRIFRTFARHPHLLRKQMSLGSLLLNHGLLKSREREIVLLRTCARCGAEYEWGVHVNAFARPLGFTDEEIAATVPGTSQDFAWNERESLLIALADALHETSTIDEELWTQLEAHWTEAQLLELIAVSGMYHAVSFMVNATGVEHEEFAERFPKENITTQP